MRTYLTSTLFNNNLKEIKLDRFLWCKFIYFLNISINWLLLLSETMSNYSIQENWIKQKPKFASRKNLKKTQQVNPPPNRICATLFAFARLRYGTFTLLSWAEAQISNLGFASLFSENVLAHTNKEDNLLE